MNKDKFQTYIDFGASKIRIGVFDYELPKNNFYSQVACISNFDLILFFSHKSLILELSS